MKFYNNDKKYAKKIRLLLALMFMIQSCINNTISYTSFQTKKSTYFNDDELLNENNRDNRIFLSKRQFIYNYYYQDSLGNKYACEIYQDSFALKYKTYSGRLDSWEEGDSNQVDKIGLYVYYGKNNGNYNQDETVIKYDYFNLFKKKGFLREQTTVRENSNGIFLHPNRSLCFNSIYVCPYPEIQQPLVVGNTWQRILSHSSPLSRWV